MSKHSISPWIVEVDPVRVGRAGERYQAIWMWAADKKSIIFNDTFHPDADTRETEIADIRLIAAAPELLDLIKEQVEVMSKNTPMGDINYCGLDWMRRAQLMIAKAEGGEG